MNDIPINLAVEDDLSEAVLRQMILQSQRNFVIGQCLKKEGFGYLKNIISGLNQAAKGTPYLVLTDLDNAQCPLAIISDWLTQPKHPNLLFRIAVREVEAWLLADREGFADFLGISVKLFPTDVDKIPDPKQFLISLTKRSRKRYLKEAIIPSFKSTAKIGKDYNGVLTHFIQQDWQVTNAQVNSPSLQRAMNALTNVQYPSQ
jgi:hypothetical protein